MGRSREAGQPVCEVCSATEDVKRCTGCQRVYYCSVAHQQQHRPQHKALCKVCGSERRTVLIIGNVGIFNWRDDFMIQHMQPHLKALPADILVIPFEAKAAEALLHTGRVAGVVVSGFQDDRVDDAPRQFCRNLQWLDALSEWVSGGGLLAFMGGEGTMLLDFFDKVFERKWVKRGDWYRRVEHALHAGAAPPALQNKLPQTYNVKATMVSDVAESEALYSPPEGATVLSHVPVPGFHGAPVEAGHCAVAVADIGSGRLMYLGDVNCEAHSVQMVRTFLEEALGSSQ